MDDAFPDGGRRLGSSLAQEVASGAIRGKLENSAVFRALASFALA